ncbi:MAG: hypothetical protein PHW52_04890, partial [Candidatus Pacebacteria bacterium]|nr:hypothetical protein [Candidatus Paceibacterota bacterium]
YYWYCSGTGGGVNSGQCSRTVAPTCTSCASWTTCSNGFQSCTALSPSGCTGGSVATTRGCGTAGSCNNAATYGCNSGSAFSQYQSGNTYYWYCSGTGGGVNSGQCSRITISICTSCASWSTCSNGSQSCTALSPSGCTGGSVATTQTCGTTGVCNNGATYGCSTGNAYNQYLSGNNFYWNCSGLNGGASSGQCSRTVTPTCTSCSTWTACSNGSQSCTALSPSGCTGGSVATTRGCGTAGSCNNSAIYGCNSGSAFSQSQSGNTYYWYCSGTGGGVNSGQCSRTVAPTCTSCASWTTCSNGSQSCTALSPSGCTGGSVATTRGCGTPGSCNNAATYGCSVGTVYNQSQSGNTYYWNCSGLGGGISSVQCTRTVAPTCTSCASWSNCSNGTQTCTVLSPIGCAGGSISTTRGCINATAGNFKTPFDLAAAGLSTDQKNQCLWCDNYYSDAVPTTEVSLTKGMAGNNLGFEFTYVNNSTDVDKVMIGYDFVITSEGNDPDSVPSSSKIIVSKNELHNPNEVVKITGFSANRAGFNSGEVLNNNSTRKELAYGKTYNWWVKVKTSSATSQWIPAGNAFMTADHQWPKVSVASINTSEIAANTVRLCSTVFPSRNGIVDPCLAACWKKSTTTKDGIVNVNFSFFDKVLQQKQLQSSAWKCSVCYNTDGEAILCQESATTIDGGKNRFEWGKTTTNFIFPSSTSNTSLKPFEDVDTDNGIYARNPFVKVIKNDASNKVKLKIRGSECPLATGLEAKSIRPIWSEK